MSGECVAREARGWRRASAILAIVVAIGCAGAGETPAPGRSAASAGAAASGAGEAPVEPGPATASVDPPAPARDLAGAAERPREPEIPADQTPLTARYTPRPLSIPRTGPGRTARFTFDGQRRAWFARMPEGMRENPLTPVYARGRVMVGGGFTSHTFYAFDARTGELDWRASAPDGGPTAAIVEDGKVLFNTESCTLFVVDVETGRQRWSRWLGDPLMSQPAAAGGRVFSGHVRDGGGYGFTAMSLANGRVLWTRNLPADVLNAPVLDGSDVFFTTMDGTVWRLDQESGRVVWRRRLDATSAPWLHGETVHVTRRERRNGSEQARVVEVAMVLAKGDGATVREHEGAPASFLPSRPDTGGVQAGWEFEGSRPTIVDGRAYQTIGNEVQARDAESGELLWRRQYTDRARGRPASSPAIAGSQMVFGTRDGVLYGLDIDTGMTAWAYDVGEPIAAQPTVAHGWVYASTTRGGVVALEVGDDALDGWHMWGGNASHSGPVVGDVAPPEEDDRPSEGTLRLEGRARAGELAGFPLQGTRVSARVSGFVARVEVEQEFTNPYSRPVEATYLFPLPESAAVDAMEMRIGSRVVRADVRRRHEAREAYDDARQRGVLASLLEQERPNLFRQSVANLRPGDTVRVVLSYTQALPYEEGSYRLTYPMVAGPRYEPRAAETPAPPTEAPTRQVVLAGGERTDRVAVSIEADLGAAIAAIESPTHPIEVTREGEARARVALREAARPDRDLEVRFRVAGAAPVVSAMTSAPTEGEEGHLALSIHPRLDVANEEIMPRELVFVVDTSSSMHGRPMELARAAMLEALHGMRPRDTFRVLGFSDDVRALSDDALEATPENVARGEQFVRGMQAFGATGMVRGIERALAGETDPGRLRVVLLMTDGYIGNESEVFRAVHAHLGDARVFAFGVGSAVNRYLLTRVAEEGRGDVQVVMPAEDPARAARAFHERIARPYLTDVTIDWNGLDVRGAYPRRLPDLFADRPLRVHARYGTPGSGEIVIRGRVAGRAYEQRVAVTLPAAGEGMREELGSIWARTRIADLTNAIELQPSEALTEEITQLGLRHHLLTPFTSFVAIDEGYRAGGEPVRVEQPASLPHGMDAPTQAMRGSTVQIAPPMRASVGISSTVRSSPADLDALLGGSMRAMGRAGGGTLAAEAAPEPPMAAAPTERARRTTTRPDGARAASGASRCYELARRADGSVDQEALERCLAGLGGAARIADEATTGEESAVAHKSGKPMAPRSAPEPAWRRSEEPW